MIRRQKYIEKVREFYDSDLIKVITGIRRCGKSVILSEILQELRKKSGNIISLDFEDASILEDIPNCAALLEYIRKNRGDGLCYVFLDEIQRVEDWAAACRTLRVKNCSVFISGSNSKLLSREFTKELSGRYVSFRVRPFVYKEILEYSKQLGKEASAGDYLIWGGFPKRFEFSAPEAQKAYLNELNETIILNDIISRYKIRNTQAFKRVANYVMISNARIFSARSVANFMKTNGLKCSVTTVAKYIAYLEEAYAIESVSLYSTKAKRELAYYQKMYDADVAFNSIRAKDGRFDLTHNFENIVYNELLYMGYEISVFNVGSKEIDFLAAKDGKEYLVQAAYSVAEEKAYEREFAVFNSLDNSRKKILITNDEVDFSTSAVQHIKFKDFLLMEDLEG